VLSQTGMFFLHQPGHGIGCFLKLSYQPGLGLQRVLSLFNELNNQSTNIIPFHQPAQC
jgi:hypothetical protein